jgi:hypothetical protein
LVLLEAVTDLLYIAGHDGAGKGKVWSFKAGDSVATDISNATVEASAEIVCIEWDSTDKILYAGTVDGKILKYDGAWSLEYDTGSSVPIVGLAHFAGTLWIAIQSGRPNIDGALGVTSWWQSSYGSWSTAGTTAPTQARVGCVLATSGLEGNFALCGTESTGHFYKTQDGKNWSQVPNDLSQSGDLLTTMENLNDGSDFYWTHNDRTNQNWYRGTLNSGGWSGGGAVGTGSCYGSHCNFPIAGKYARDWLFMDHGYHRIYCYQAGVGGAGWVQEADLPGGGASDHRCGFALLGGVCYAVVEHTNQVLYHRTGNDPGVWSVDINTGSGAFLDAVQGEDFTVALQFRRNQIKNREIIQAHHEELLAHAVRVDFSVMKDDQPSGPPGSPTSGDTYWLSNAGAATGAWASFTQNDVVQYSAENAWVKLTAGMTDGEKIRISSSPATTATFSGWASQLAEWDSGSSAFVNNLTPEDGVQVVETGYSSSYWYKEPMVYESSQGDYTSIGAAVSIDPNDNALQIDVEKLKHREQLGHDWANPNGYNPGVVLGTVATGAGAGAQDKFTYIATTGASWAHPSGGTYSASAGDYVYNNFGTWVKVGSRADGDVLIVPASVLTPTGSFSGHSGDIALWDTTSATYTFLSPKVGDLYSAAEPESGTHVWRDTQFFYDGNYWRVSSQDPDKIQSDTVDFDTNREFVVVTASGLDSDSNGVKVDLGVQTGIQYNAGDGSLELNLKSNGGLTLDANGLYVGPTASTTAISASNPVADKQYVLNQLQGLDWQSPAQVLKVRDDLHSAGPTTPYTGLAMIAASGVTDNWAAFTENDLLEWSGSTWVKITSVVSGTRVIVAPTGATGSFSSYDNYIADLSGGTWAFTGPQDGWAILTIGENSYYENMQWVYDVSPTGWTQIGAQQIYSASGGLYANNNKFELDFVMDSRTPSGAATGVSFTGLTIKGSSLVDAYVSMYRNGQKLLRNDAGPTIGEFKWDNANSHAYVAASDAFQSDETMEIVAFGKP